MKEIDSNTFYNCGINKISIPSCAKINSSCIDKSININFYDLNKDPDDKLQKGKHYDDNDNEKEDYQCTFIQTGEKDSSSINDVAN